MLCAGGGKLPPPAPSPLVGPTTLQVVAIPLLGAVFILEEAQKGTLTSQSIFVALLLVGDPSAQTAKERSRSTSTKI